MNMERRRRQPWPGGTTPDPHTHGSLMDMPLRDDSDDLPTSDPREWTAISREPESPPDYPADDVSFDMRL